VAAPALLQKLQSLFHLHPEKRALSGEDETTVLGAMPYPYDGGGMPIAGGVFL
jgi:hypothetical protein